MYTEFVTQSAGQEHTSASYRYRHTHEHFEWESVFSSRHFIYVSAFFMKSQQFFCRCGIFVCILHNTNSTWQFHAMKQKRTDNTMELCWKLRYFWWCTLADIHYLLLMRFKCSWFNLLEQLNRFHTIEHPWWTVCLSCLNMNKSKCVRKILVDAVFVPRLCETHL